MNILQQTITLGGGCFWCVEAVMKRIKGVTQIVPGYAGGNVPGTPTYREVCSGLTGHAEVIQLTFDAKEIALRDLLEIFMTTHDPTSLNRQGGDVGTQYRSVIFYHDEYQNEIAEEVLAKLAGIYQDPIVTELKPLDVFYSAEEEHHNFYDQNPEYGYCATVISPKLAKLRKDHARFLD